MKNSVTKNIIGIYELAGGIIGLGLFLIEFRPNGESWINWAILIFTSCVCLLSIYSGILLFKDKKGGIVLSLLTQFFQLPSFIILGFNYLLYLGLQLTLSVVPNGFTIVPGIGTHFSIGLGEYFINPSTGAHFQQTVAGINLFALVIMIFLIKDYVHNKKKIWVTLIAIIIILLAVIGGIYVYNSQNTSNTLSLHWQTYNSTADQFSIYMPNYPVLNSEQDIVIPNSNKTYSWHSYTSQTNTEAFYVYKYIYSNTIDTSNPDNILKGYLNIIVNAVSGSQLISSNYTYYSSYRALDFSIQISASDFLKGRFIEVGQTPYYLAYEYPSPQDYNDADYQKFINSFQLK